MDIFFHVRMLMGMIVSLSIALLFRGAMRLIEKRHRNEAYWLHLAWTFYVFLVLIHFWWWEMKLTEVENWIFFNYFFLIFYTGLYFVLCTLLFPDDLTAYTNYKNYFFKGKKWFFIVLILTYIADFADTYIKGREYLAALGWAYVINKVFHIILCVIAIKVTNKRYHAALVLCFIVFEIIWILIKY